jgi:type I restriction-modification system DNA methylase subunit
MTARLSSTEVKKRLQVFSKRFRHAENEQREATIFWASFYDCFGISAAESTVYEKQVRKLDGNVGRIDSFIPGLLIVEHKSRGSDLDAAYEQAEEYFIALKPEERPKYIITSDFARIVIYDLATKQRNETSIEDLPKNASWFKFLVEGKQEAIVEEREIDRSAAYTISKLHEALLKINFKGRDLEVFLTRLLFCLFADDTGIFNENGQFRRLVENSREDGSDVGQRIGELFDVLNTSDDDRFITLEDSLKAFPYVNGNLFSERTRIPVFNSELRKLLISCATLDWSGISPAIFGAMFQGVLEEHNTTEKRQATRRELGAHYTSERNILRVISPLFLDDLREEFESCKRTKNKIRLKSLYDKLPTLNFFDPACGCGNFLVIAYRELRKLENDVIAELFGYDEKMIGGTLDVSSLCRVKLTQFYGIEIDEAAAHIARVALYITDHQLNVLSAQRFGYSRPTIPLTDNPRITVGNALRIDWEEVLPSSHCTYLFGNPPFIGKQNQTDVQKEDMEIVFQKVKNFSLLDYVSCWYLKAANYITDNQVEVAFVSTNSIVQGEQVSVLWSELNRRQIKINFSHRTFKWSNEGKGNAAVHCVIVGFSKFDRKQKFIFNYQDGIDKEPTKIDAKLINPYLVDAPFILLESRRTPISKAKEIVFGNMPNDGGFLFLTKEERAKILEKYPEAVEFIKPFLGADEFINNLERWCIWLADVDVSKWRHIKPIYERVEQVKLLRLESTREATRKLAKTPYLFGEIRQEKGEYILIPRHSSENREYIPIGFFDDMTICGDANLMVPSASLYDFSILTSKMSMAWVKTVCGRIKSDFRYSNTIVYNNFPWPLSPSKEAEERCNTAASSILKARSNNSSSNLASLYDPLTMPLDLRESHENNDRAVDKAYGYKGKDDDASRVAFLLKLYEEQTSLLPASQTKKKRTKIDVVNKELL